MTTLLIASIGLLVGCVVYAWLKFGKDIEARLEHMERFPEGL